MRVYMVYLHNTIRLSTVGVYVKPLVPSSHDTDVAVLHLRRMRALKRAAAEAQRLHPQMRRVQQFKFPHQSPGCRSCHRFSTLSGLHPVTRPD